MWTPMLAEARRIQDAISGTKSAWSVDVPTNLAISHLPLAMRVPLGVHFEFRKKTQDPDSPRAVLTNRVSRRLKS